jgi:hypothetical protein
MQTTPSVDSSREPAFPERTFVMERLSFSTFEIDEPPGYPGGGDDMNDDKQVYPRGLKLATIVFALCLAVFCVALDNTV